MSEDVPIDYLEECFHVDYLTGVLVWKYRPSHHFDTDMAYKTVNSRQSGKVSGLTATNGYRYVGLRGIGKSKKSYLLHRVIYAMFHGTWPTETVDHFDGDITNNGISNLREVPQSVNMRNQKKRSTNLSGCNGVRWYTRKSKWHSQGTFQNKSYHLGYFNNLFDAICARKAWELNYNFTERHGK